MGGATTPLVGGPSAAVRSIEKMETRRDSSFYVVRLPLSVFETDPEVSIRVSQYILRLSKYLRLLVPLFHSPNSRAFSGRMGRKFHSCT